MSPRPPWARLGLVTLVVLGLLLPGRPFGAPWAPPPAPPRTLALAPSVVPAPAASRFARDPAIPGDGVGRVLVTNTDPAAVPNTGLRTDLAGFRVNPFTGPSSLQVGAEEVLGSYLVVFGLFQNSAAGAYPFFSVFNNTTGRAVVQENESYYDVPVGGVFDFQLRLALGTNWTLTLNGEPFGGSPTTATVNLGVSASTDANGIAYSMVALSVAPVVPADTLDYTAFAVRLGSAWYLPEAANSTWRGASEVRWGLQGAAQNASLWPGELVVGTDPAELPNGTLLWTGGPRLGAAQLTADPATATGGGTSMITASFSDGTGGLSGLPVAFTDSGGGSFVAPDPLTNATGIAGTAYLAPNVTSNTSDVLTVSSNVLGLLASATTVMAVSPSIQVVVVPLGSPTVPPGGTSDLLLQATRAGSGAPLSGVLLDFAVLGGGGVAPNSQVTDAQGRVHVNLTAPTTPGTVLLTIVVASPGYWGSARISITNPAPGPTVEQQVLALLPWIVGAVLVLALVLVYRRSRLPKGTLPPMDLRRRRPPPVTMAGRTSPAAPPPIPPGVPKGPR
jgi:hypothetical protein